MRLKNNYDWAWWKGCSNSPCCDCGQPGKFVAVPYKLSVLDKGSHRGLKVDYIQMGICTVHFEIRCLIHEIDCFRYNPNPYNGLGIEPPTEEFTPTFQNFFRNRVETGKVKIYGRFGKV